MAHFPIFGLLVDQKVRRSTHKLDTAAVEIIKKPVEVLLAPLSSAGAVINKNIICKCIENFLRFNFLIHSLDVHQSNQSCYIVQHLHWEAAKVLENRCFWFYHSLEFSKTRGLFGVGPKNDTWNTFLFITVRSQHLGLGVPNSARSTLCYDISDMSTDMVSCIIISAYWAYQHSFPHRLRICKPMKIKVKIFRLEFRLIKARIQVEKLGHLSNWAVHHYVGIIGTLSKAWRQPALILEAAQIQH